MEGFAQVFSLGFWGCCFFASSLLCGEKKKPATATWTGLKVETLEALAALLRAAQLYNGEQLGGSRGHRGMRCMRVRGWKGRICSGGGGGAALLPTAPYAFAAGASRRSGSRESQPEGAIPLPLLQSMLEVSATSSAPQGTLRVCVCGRNADRLRVSEGIGQPASASVKPEERGGSASRLQR